MKRTVTLALLLTAAICWAQVAVNYMPDENVVRTFGEGDGPWYGKPVAVSIQLDDLYKVGQDSLWGVINSYGVKASVVAPLNLLGLSSSYYGPAEVEAFYNQGHEIVFHSTYHGRRSGVDAEDWPFTLLQYADEDSLRDELERSPFFSELTFLNANNCQTFAYPNNVHSDAAIDTLLAMGFIGARGAVIGTDASSWDYSPGVVGGAPTGILAPLTWTGSSNIFKCALYNGEFQPIVGDRDDDYNEATVKANTTAMIDEAVARGDSPLIVLYAHDTKYVNTSYSGGIDPDELGWVLEALQADSRVKMTRFQDALRYYRARHVSSDGINWTLPGYVEPQTYVFSNSSTAAGIGTPDYHITADMTDGELDATDKNNSYGDHSLLRLLTIAAGTEPHINPSFSQTAGLICFDVADDLAGKTVVSGSLFLRHDWTTRDLSGPGEGLFVATISDTDLAAWTPESDVSYNYSDVSTTTAWVKGITEYDTWPEIGAYTSLSVSLVSNTWYEIELTSAMIATVQDWIDGTSAEGGFLIEAVQSSAGNQAYFASPKNTSDTARRPYLRLVVQ